MIRWWPKPIRPWGLRTRLLVASALLCVVTAAVVAGGIYVQARIVILQKAQDTAVQTMTRQLEELYPLRDPRPDSGTLTEIAGAVLDRDSSAVATYHGEHSQTGLDPAEIPTELRRAVREGSTAWQRVELGGEPVLIIGTPLMIVSPDRSVQPSGIEVYSRRSLLAEEHSIGRFATIAWLTGGVALLFAIVLALLAARSVLRPVRELGRVARLLGAGELGTRAEVRGSDELAEVAHTFNNTAAELEHHVEQLRAMEADARRFAADVSHELRTPLAAMAAVTDVLDEEASRLPEQTARAAKLVSQETRNLTRLVNDLIEISRFDSGAAVLALDDIDVAELVRATLRTRGWSERVHTELPAGVSARLDPRRVDVIIANLVGNALRHGEPPVSVQLHADSEWLTLDVRDHGPGLAPDVLPHVFDRFYKADAARTRSDGSGLGAAIARENARLHQGSLDAANGQDGGARFTLRLPRQAHDADDERDRR